MLKYGIIAAVMLAAVTGLMLTAKSYLDQSFDRGYAAGTADCRAKVLAASEKKRVEDQAKIDDIRRRAEAEIAARVSTNVQKALADARKANPDCNPANVPGSVLDLLRRGGPR